MATLGGHQVFFCFAGKDREEIEDVKKKILICVWHRVDEFLVRRDDHVLVVWRFRYRISSAARQKKWLQAAYRSRLGTMEGTLAQNGHSMNKKQKRKLGANTYGKIQIMRYHGLLSLQTCIF